MKILCISDTIDNLIYSESITTRFSDIDCVIAAGDLPMDYIGFIASSLMKPIFFIFGNHNLRYIANFKRSAKSIQDQYFLEQNPDNILPRTFGATYMNENSIKFRNILIAGLGGSRKYNNGPNQFTELQMAWKIMKLLPKLVWNRLRYGRFLDILITHAPPLGVHDKEDFCHRGFASFLWFMKVLQPRYLLHGHIHLYDANINRSSSCYNTQVINVFSHYILDIEEEK